MAYTDNGRDSTDPRDYSRLWETLRGLRDDFAAHRPRLEISGDDTADHDVREAVLRVLTEKPATGAAVIRTVTERSTDGWVPPAAEVYPTLQLLVDEGLATVSEDNGRRTFTLTEDGREEAAGLDSDADDSSDTDWSELFAPLTRLADASPFGGTFTRNFSDLPKAGLKLGQAVREVLVSGDRDHIDRVTALLDETRRKIYGILAEEPAASPDKPADGPAEDSGEDSGQTPGTPSTDDGTSGDPAAPTAE